MAFEFNDHHKELITTYRELVSYGYKKLGIIMLAPVVFIWLIALFASRIKKFLRFLQ